MGTITLLSLTFSHLVCSSPCNHTKTLATYNCATVHNVNTCSQTFKISGFCISTAQSMAL